MLADPNQHRRTLLGERRTEVHGIKKPFVEQDDGRTETNPGAGDSVSLMANN